MEQKHPTECSALIIEEMGAPLIKKGDVINRFTVGMQITVDDQPVGYKMGHVFTVYETRRDGREAFILTEEQAEIAGGENSPSGNYFWVINRGEAYLINHPKDAPLIID